MRSNTKTVDLQALLLNILKCSAKNKERSVVPALGSGVDADTAYSISHVPEVYAALGTLEEGATLNDIVARTQLLEMIITAALEQNGGVADGNEKEISFLSHSAPYQSRRLKKSGLI